MNKLCPKCGITGEENFYRNRASLDGFQTYCKTCHTKITNTYSKLNPQIVNKLNAMWRENNQKKFKESQKKYAKTEKGRIRQKKANEKYKIKNG